MGWLTADEMKAVRLEGSVLIPIPGIKKQLRAIVMSAEAGLTASELQAEVKEGKRKQIDFFKFFLKHGALTEDGDPFTEQDVDDLSSVLSIDTLRTVIEKAGAAVKKGSDAAEGKAAGQTATSPSVSA